MRKRNHIIPLHLNKKELAHLETQVKQSGLPREEFLRTLIMGAELRAKPCDHHADLLHKVAGLCNNANQLAKVANTYGEASQQSVEEMTVIARQVWTAIAYTSVIPVHRLDNAIDYALDEKKSSRAENRESLEGEIDKALNKDQSEQDLFQSAIGCTIDSAFEDMCQIKKIWHKEKGVQGFHLVQSFAKGEGKPTWRTVIRMDIRDAIGVSFSWSQFVKEMEKRGYTWKLNRKYPALKTPDMERYVRLRSLGKGYGEAEIREKILRPKIQQVYGKTQVQFPKRKLTGLQKLYFSYLYRMGVLQQKPKRISYAVRSDIRKLDLRIRQMEFLQKEGINTREELVAYRKPLEEQVLSLMKERRMLYRKEPRSMRLQEINGELKELRKKIRLSQQIEIQSKEMEERLKRTKEQEKVQESSGKQRREEERKR